MTTDEVKVSVRDFTAVDLQAAIKLGQSYYPTDSPCLNREYLQWLYFQNPHGTATLVVAQIDDEWAGMTALIPVRLRRGTEVARARYAVNVLSHPAHRTKNIFVKMISAMKLHLSGSDELLIGHPNAAAVPGWKRQKMEFRDDLYPCVVLPNLKLGGHKWQRLSDPRAIARVKFGADTGETFRIDHDSDYVTWRYLRAPHRAYNVYVSNGHGGFGTEMIVTRRFRAGTTLCVDWTSDGALKNGLGFAPYLAMLPLQVRNKVIESRRGVALGDGKKIPFFATSFGNVSRRNSEFAGVTLGASDF